MSAGKRRRRAGLAMAVSLAWSAPSAAALTCEHIFAIAQSVVRYRDQGHALGQVLDALKGVETEGKLTPAETEVLRQSISLVYLGQASPEEIALECVQARDAARR